MKKIGLLGEKLGHSFSPYIHSKLGDYSYELCEIPQDELSDFLKENNYDGFNVTIPYKESVISFCDELSEKAEQIGSVNTLIKKENGFYYGDNTDYDGFLFMIKPVVKELKGKKVLVLGSGGAAKTVKKVMRDIGAREIVTISRSGADNYENICNHNHAEVIINTTPVGMYPNNGISPVNLDNFPKCIFVADLIYNPAKTALMLQAGKRCIRYETGLSMLVEQARASAEQFMKNEISERRSVEIAENIEKKIKNIILIGMPGSGKSSVGKCLSEITGRPFVDIDKEIVKKVGRVIPKIFLERGEKYFRKKESEVLSEFCKECGLIIATGGGVVTVPENKDILRQNGTVVYIKRELKELATAGRPVTAAEGVEEIYRKRAPLYESWNDLSVENNKPHLTAKKIAEELKL